MFYIGLLILLFYKIVSNSIQLVCNKYNYFFEDSKSKYNESVDKIAVVSSLIYLTNAAHGVYISAPYLYIQSFLILVATSVVYRIFNTKVTRIADKCAIANLLFHGTVNARQIKDEYKYIFLSFIFVVFVFIHDNLLFYKHYNKYELIFRHSIFIHFISSIGHHYILLYSI